MFFNPLLQLTLISSLNIIFTTLFRVFLDIKSWKQYFHSDLTPADATELLSREGITDGTFLVRPNRRSPGNYTLCFRCHGDILHINISKNSESWTIGGEQFSSLHELVTYYCTNEAFVEKDSDQKSIDLQHPFYSTDQAYASWYHGNITDLEAETLLNMHHKSGNFLIRECQRTPGNLVLSIRRDDNTYVHLVIKCLKTKRETCFCLHEGQKFETLTQLLRQAALKGLGLKSRAHVYLKKPVNATHFIALFISQRIKELEKPPRKTKKQKDQPANIGFKQEFEHLQQQPTMSKHSRKEGSKPEHRTRNRYKNILPYDDTRVILHSHDSNVAESQYINANYVDPQKPPTSHQHPQVPFEGYIATQGCVKDTVKDLWRMVLQENSQIIAMTTNLVESGKNKCVRYWPETKENALEFDTSRGKIKVSLKADTTYTNFKVREFVAERYDTKNPKHDMKPRSVFQYHFTTWPDKSVPKTPDGVLDYIEEIRKKRILLKDKGRIIVHCSAGIGRTGTFIVIDIILKKIIERGMNCEIDISNIIEHLRDDRMGIVQTEAQYKFIYSAVGQYVETKRQRQTAQESNTYGNLEFEPNSTKRSDISKKAGHQHTDKPIVPKKPAPKPVDVQQIYENMELKPRPGSQTPVIRR